MPEENTIISSTNKMEDKMIKLKRINWFNWLLLLIGLFDYQKETIGWQLKFGNWRNLIRYHMSNNNHNHNQNHNNNNNHNNFEQSDSRGIPSHIPIQTTAGTPSTINQSPSDLLEKNPTQIFVCTNRYCREKGSDATMASFTYLTPPNVTVVGVNCLGRCNRGPNVRILTSKGEFIDESMVRSVEKVVEILRNNLRIDINLTSAEVLRLNYEGNIYLRSGEVDKAIVCYDKALEFGDKNQEPVLLVMRGTALLQRAYAYRLLFKDILFIAEQVLPLYDNMMFTFNTILADNTWGSRMVVLQILAKISILYQQLDASPRWNEVKSLWSESKLGPLVTSGDDLLTAARFHWSLYEYSLTKALQDVLLATVLLPGFAQAWRRAGDALSEVRLYSRAAEYYEVAVSLDPTLQEILLPSIEKVRMLDRLVTNAELKGLPTDTVLALVED